MPVRPLCGPWRSRRAIAAACPPLLKPMRLMTALSSTRRNRRGRSEEHTSELQSLMRISYAVFCLKKKKQNKYNLCRPEQVNVITCGQNLRDRVEADSDQEAQKWITVPDRSSPLLSTLNSKTART